MSKKPTEIMEILTSYDLTRTPWSAAQLVGCDPKTVQRYVALRDAGLDPRIRRRRPHLIDPHLAKIEEWVERSQGKVRADVVHERLCKEGYGGTERTTRRAVSEAKARYRAGHRRSYRPWIPEPGGWLQFDWGEGPRVGGRRTYLFCAWLAWSRFRVVLATWDQKVETLLTCLDATLRRLGGAPSYVLTDNARTVTSDRVAGVPIRHPVLVAACRHYGMELATCVVADPESKGGVESTVKLAKADLVPTGANLLPEYGSFAELSNACAAFCEEVNGRVHRETGQRPDERLLKERADLHRLPEEPYTAALGETRTVNEDQTVRFGSVRYSTPPGWVGEQVWCRVEGEELILIGRSADGGLREIWRHQLSVPGHPQVVDAHYPDHPSGREALQPRLRAQDEAEASFLALGSGAEQWLRQAAASGAGRVRAVMAKAVDLALLSGTEEVEAALRRAADAARFGEDDLISILSHQGGQAALQVVADESFSAQPGTSAWEAFGRAG